jgi:type VI secretion system protein
MSVFRKKEKIFGLFLPLLAIGLVSCTIEDMPELSIESVSIYAEPDANQNSATAVDLVLVYNQELLKTIGKMSAAKYFSASKQLLLDNPSLIDVWHWELVPGQIVDNFRPSQDKGDAFGAYVFANYLTPGDHRVKVAPDGIVKILLLRDDLKNLAMANTHDMNMGKTMSDVMNVQVSRDEGCPRPCQRRLGPAKIRRQQPCRRSSPPPCAQVVDAPCMRPSAREPIQILTRPLNAPPAVTPKPYMVR